MDDLDPDTHVRDCREAARGLGGARHDEWLVATWGGFPGPFVYGTFDVPKDGEPLIARFRHPDQGWSAIMVVQRLAPGIYLNLVDGTTVIEWPDDRVLVYSGVSRVSGPVSLVQAPTGEVLLVEERPLEETRWD